MLTKTLVWVCCALCITSSLFAQTEPQPFGEFSTRDKSLKTVDFDPGADAVILQDVATANYNDNYNLVFDRRVRIKILKEKGIAYGNVEIPYYSKDGFETITNVEGVVLSLDGNNQETWKQLRRSDVFRTQVNERVSLVKFALPDVKVGSILEYHYQSTSKHYGGLENWYFQSELPTLLSSFYLTVVPNAEFRYNVKKRQDLPIYLNNAKGSGMVKFQMANIAGLRNEPYMDSPKDYLQHVDFQFTGYVTSSGNKVDYMQKWGDVSKELMSESYFGKQIDKVLANSEAAINTFNAIAPLEKRLAAIHRYVNQQFSWDGIKSKFAYKDLKEVWEKKKGNSGEINLIFINLCKKAGLTVYPLLVSERSNGKVFTEVPILDNFNKTLAYIEIGDKQFVVDAIDEHTPLNLIPSSVLNTTGFIVHNKTGRLKELKDDARANTTLITVVQNINPNGQADGEVNVLCSDYARVSRLRDYMRDKEDFKTNYFTSAVPGISIDSLTVSNAENDSLPFEQSLAFHLPANVSGNYKIISTNLFTGLTKNPFISDNRFSNINFGSKQHTALNAQFILPEDLKPEELPKSVRLTLPDNSISLTRTVSVTGNTIYVQIVLKIDNPVFTSNDYPMVQAFYKKMFSYLDEQIVLTNK